MEAKRSASTLELDGSCIVIARFTDHAAPVPPVSDCAWPVCAAVRTVPTPYGSVLSN